MKQTNGLKLFTAFLQKCHKFCVNAKLNPIFTCPSFSSNIKFWIFLLLIVIFSANPSFARGNSHSERRHGGGGYTIQNALREQKEKSERKKNLPFIKLCQSGSAKQVRDAIKAGANVNITLDDMTPLMWAAKYNTNSDVIQTLLEAGADNQARGSFHGKDTGTKSKVWAVALTPLEFASAYNENPEIIRILLNLASNSRSRSHALLYAASFNTLDVVQVFLDAKVDVNAYEILIHAARYTENPQIIDMLLDAGADVHQTIRPYNLSIQAIDEARKNKNLQGTATLKRLEELSK